MMRPIKFRQWISERKIMYYGIGISEGCWTGMPSVTFSRDPLLEFTGLLDKNGKEIYEGDLIKTRGGALYGISFMDGCFVAMNKYSDDCLSTRVDYFTEVIGNIYENHDLVAR